MALFGGEAAVQATAVNITTLLSLPRTLHAKQIIIQVPPNITAPVFIGKSNVTTTTNRLYALNIVATTGAFVVLGQGDWKSLNTDEVYIIGTVNAANIVFITIIE